MTDTNNPTSLREEADLAWLLRVLAREKYTGHCGEENAEIRARNDHNERCDRLIEALSRHPVQRGDAHD